MTWHTEAGGDAGLPVLASLRDAGRGGVFGRGLQGVSLRSTPCYRLGWLRHRGVAYKGGALPPSYGLMAPPSDAAPALMGADVPAVGLSRFLILFCHVEVW